MTLISNLLESRKSATSLITFSEDMKVCQVLEGLSKNGIRSAIVTRGEIGNFGNKVKSIIGVVDCSDILNFMHFQELFKSESLKGELFFRWPSFLNTPIKSILAACTTQTTQSSMNLDYLTAQDSVLDLVKVFANGGKAAFVIGQKLFLMGVAASSSLDWISPLDVLEYFWLETPPALIQIFRKPLVYIEKPMLALNELDYAVTGFRAMQANNVHSIPILSKGNFLTSISAMHICAITNPKAIDKLSSSQITSFLATDTEKSSVESHLSTEATFEQAVHVMVTERAHHIWILDSIHQVKGFVTPTDILKLIYDALSKEA